MTPLDRAVLAARALSDIDLVRLRTAVRLELESRGFHDRVVPLTKHEDELEPRKKLFEEAP